MSGRPDAGRTTVTTMQTDGADPVGTVRAMFDAYLAQDRGAAERLLARDLTFTSPQDDHIDRAAYLERCFPTVDRVAWQRIVKAVDAGDGEVYVTYRYELKEGGEYQNTELITVRDGRIAQIQVFFGGPPS